MDDDDLPPRPARNNDNGFAGELGRTVAGTVMIGIFIVIAAAVLYFVVHGLGHSP